MQDAPQPAPAVRDMPAFLQSMMQANKNIICTASGASVKKVSVEYLLRQRLRIPIFQRRYCWGEAQWNTLFDDLVVLLTGSDAKKHSLGRLTCVIGNDADDRVLVVDGQQRNTTSVLLLAAIRDVATARGDATCESVANELDSLLCPDKDAMEVWLAQRRECTGRKVILEEGEALDFAALVPTYCDRAAFFAAIMPPHAGVSANAVDWQRPMEAKDHFVTKLTDYDAERLSALAQAVLHRLEWLFFPVDLSHGLKDGTEDLQVIFERLAVRDATFCKPTRETEFANMGAADFVRNLMLGSFGLEADAVDVYRDHWLPVERAASLAATRLRHSGVGQMMDSMLEAFLQAQPEKLPELPAHLSCGPIGGMLYPRFRRWLIAALAAHEVGGEDAAKKAIIRVNEFALEYFADGGATLLAKPKIVLQKAVSIARPLLTNFGFGGKHRKTLAWSCTNCNFRCPRQSAMCSACGLQKTHAEA